MNTLINCLINFSILAALMACYQDPNVLQSPSPAQSETSPEACICLEDLHPISPQQLWQQFFQQRGAGIVWQELQKSTPEIHINLYELEQPLINNAVLQIVKGSIRYLNYHHAAVVRLKFTGEIDNQNKQLNILPTEIGDLVGLQELSLQENALSELPADIGKLSQLLKLDLAYNQLNELPLEIGDLVHLTELDLTGNYISELPSETSQLVNLTSLNMASNSLLQFPSVIGNLIKLKQLNLSGNHLYKLPAAFKKLTNLQLLDLSTNLLTKLPSSIGELPYLNNILLSQNEFIALPASIHTKLNQSELRNNPWIASQNLIEISPTDLATQCYQKLPPSLLDICGRYILNTYNLATTEECGAITKKLPPELNPIILRKMMSKNSLVQNQRIVYFQATNHTLTPFYWDQAFYTVQGVKNMLENLKNKSVYLMAENIFQQQKAQVKSKRYHLLKNHLN